MCLNSLDKLEVHPTFYKRDDVEVVTCEEPTSRLTCSTYWLINYKPCLLDLPMINDYTLEIATVSQRYIPPEERRSGYMTREQVQIMTE